MTGMLGQSLGRYHILEQLGEGGMAVVYQAYDTRLESDVAVKIIRTENLPQSGVERALKRFEREAKALAKLTHPNIVKVIDYGEYQGKPYLVMEYLPGGTLKGKMGRPLPWEEAVHTLRPIAESLRYAHGQNMIHRDVKPSNILLTQDGHPMLTDFGIAKILDLEETQDLTGTSAAVGTPEYMAPEQSTAKNVDLRADIYALGVVLYEMVTGRKPFVADTPMAVLIMHARDPLPSPRKYVPELPERVEGILLKALAKRPEERYQNMAEFVAALDTAIREGSLGTAVPMLVKDDSKTIEEVPPATPPASIFSAQTGAGQTPAWQKWIPWAALIVLFGCTLTIGSALVDMGKDGRGLLAGLATDTPRLTSTPVPSPTPIPSSTPTFNPMNPIFSHTHILWDITHGVGEGVAPENYGILRNNLEALGFTIEITNDISTENLLEYRALVVNLGWAMKNSYSRSEAQWILEYVSQGGGLVILGDHSGMPNDHLAPITDILNLKLGVGGTGSITRLELHPIFSGVDAIWFNAGGEIQPSVPWMPICWDSDNAVCMAVLNYGQGRIVALGDINIWNDSWITQKSNTKLAHNVFLWVTHSDMP